ncbi:MAG: hypothetical protein ACD_73C00685G0002 [uncultured bacterium]|nr:MAG: hypothetical protein ACD_73C00685G0002 [uncultured bacterium]
MNDVGGMRRLSLYILVIICGFQIGCAKGLNGTIYLDENGNTKQDSTEVLLAGLTFTVTLDGKEIDTGITAEDGTYDVEMDGSGEYCVEVSASDLVNSDVTRVGTLLVPYYHLKTQTIRFAKKIWKALPIGEAFAEVTPTETLCSDGVDNDEDGSTDCDDSDCSGDSACSVNDCVATDSDTDGVPDCTESLCSAEDVCDTDTTTTDTDSPATITNGKACDTAKGLILTLDVPIAVDYTTTVADIDTTETKSQEVGDNFTLDITYPKTCTLDEIKLPEYTEPATAAIKTNYYSTSTHKIDLQKAIDLTNDAGLCDEDAPGSASLDALVTCPLELNLIDDGIIGDETGTFQPTVTCPDDESYDLTEFTLNKEGSNDLVIVISHADTDGDNTWSINDAVTTTITITNNSTIDLSSSDFEFDIDTPTTVSGQDTTITDGTCTGSQTISCNFDIAASTTVTVTIDYTLPGTISAATDFTTTATLTLNETTSNPITESGTFTALAQ